MISQNRIFDIKYDYCKYIKRVLVYLATVYVGKRVWVFHFESEGRSSLRSFYAQESYGCSVILTNGSLLFVESSERVLVSRKSIPLLWIMFWSHFTPSLRRQLVIMRAISCLLKLVD